MKGGDVVIAKPADEQQADLMEAERGRCSRESITQPMWASWGGFKLCLVFFFLSIWTTGKNKFPVNAFSSTRKNVQFEKERQSKNRKRKMTTSVNCLNKQTAS